MSEGPSKTILRKSGCVASLMESFEAPLSGFDSCTGVPAQPIRKRRHSAAIAAMICLIEPPGDVMQDELYLKPGPEDAPSFPGPA
jgi:hypothetical protein